MNESCECNTRKLNPNLLRKWIARELENQLNPNKLGTSQQK